MTASQFIHQHSYWAHLAWPGNISRSKATWGHRCDVPLTFLYDHQSHDEHAGWIYAVMEDRTPLVKIGHTRQGTGPRLQSLAYAYQIDAVLVATVYVPTAVRQLESIIHGLLSAEHIEGEWFYLSITQRELEQLVAQAHEVLHWAALLQCRHA